MAAITKASRERCFQKGGGEGQTLGYDASIYVAKAGKDAKKAGVEKEKKGKDQDDIARGGGEEAWEGKTE